MNTNQKGNRGQIEVISDLYKRGFHVFLPFDDYSPVDLIALASGKCVRLQVKYRSKNRYGSYLLEARSVVNGKAVMIDRSLIDGWALYLQEDNLVKYVNVKQLDNCGSLSVRPEMNMEDDLFG